MGIVRLPATAVELLQLQSYSRHRADLSAELDELWDSLERDRDFLAMADLVHRLHDIGAGFTAPP